MDKKIEELLPFYALDALTDEEKELVEAYLVDHPEVRAQMDDLQSAADVIPYGVTLVKPPRRIKDALMARVAVDQRAHSSTQNQPSRPRAMRLANIFQAFSLGAAVAAILWVVVLNIQLSQVRNEVSTLHEAVVTQANSLEQINQLRNEVSILREAVIAQANSLEQINQSVDQINAKLPQTPVSAVVTISLKGTDAQPQAQGQLIADPNSQSAVLVIAGLGQLEAGKTYQVWLIDSGGPKSAGLLAVDANGQAVLIVTSTLTIGEFNALGISIEPDGGSPQPTGDIVVLSDL